MSNVYRIRPCNDYTIDEIENHYLWFSRRSGFNDLDDSNIGSFLHNNPALLKTVEQVFTEEELNELINKLDCTGICCFSSIFPSFKSKCHYPNSKSCICIEYDKKVLEAFFLERYAISNCFSKVQYFDCPLIFQQDDEFHVVTQKNEDGFISESIKSIIYNERSLGRFITILLTRINSRYSIQNEERIILGGKNIPSFLQHVDGYKIVIPPKAVTNIHKFKDTHPSFWKRIIKLYREFYAGNN